jgi:hypothetical protein
MNCNLWGCSRGIAVCALWEAKDMLSVAAMLEDEMPHQCFWGPHGCMSGCLVWGWKRKGMKCLVALYVQLTLRLRKWKNEERKEESRFGGTDHGRAWWLGDVPVSLGYGELWQWSSCGREKGRIPPVLASWWSHRNSRRLVGFKVSWGLQASVTHLFLSCWATPRRCFGLCLEVRCGLALKASSLRSSLTLEFVVSERLVRKRDVRGGGRGDPINARSHPDLIVFDVGHGLDWSAVFTSEQGRLDVDIPWVYGDESWAPGGLRELCLWLKCWNVPLKWIDELSFGGGVLHDG